MSFDGDLQQGTRVSRQEDAENILQGVNRTGFEKNETEGNITDFFYPNL